MARSEAETKLDIAVGHALRIGVSLAAVVVFAGWILMMAHQHAAKPHYSHFHGSPILLTHPTSIFTGQYGAVSEKIIMVGILLLIATPVARVIMCISGFALEKSKLYVLVSTFVLVVLIYSLFFRA